MNDVDENKLKSAEYSMFQQPTFIIVINHTIIILVIIVIIKHATT